LFAYSLVTHEDPITITDVRLFQPAGFIPVRSNKLPPTFFESIRDFLWGAKAIKREMAMEISTEALKQFEE
jgi:hypothetical protein